MGGREKTQAAEEVEAARPRRNEIYIPSRGAAYSFREPLVSRNLLRLRDPVLLLPRSNITGR